MKNKELVSTCCGTPKFGDWEICGTCCEHTDFTNDGDED